MSNHSPERKASSSTRKAKDTGAGHRSTTPGAPVDNTLLTPMVRSKRTPIACTECRRRQVKCSGATPQCERCEKRGVKCEYIPIHVQRQQTAAAAAGGSPIHGMSPPSAASRSLPSTPQPWPPSASPQFIATSRHSPASYHDWPEYYDLSAELSADSRRQIQPQSAPSYLGTESLGQCQPYASRYQTYGHNVVNGPHYPVSVADAYGPSSGNDGSGVGQAVGYPMPMENTSQVISGANQGSVRPSYPTQYLQDQEYYDEPSGAPTSQGQLYLGWTDLNDVNYSTFQGQSYRRNA